MRPRLKQLETTGTSAQILAWSAGSSIWAPKDYFFGDYVQEAESLASSSTGAETWTQKLRMTTSSLPEGNYLISWSYERGGYWTGWPQQQIQVDDTTTIHFAYSGRLRNSSDRNSHCGNAVVALSAGVHNIDFDFRLFDEGGGTCYVQNVRLAIWRLVGTWSPTGAGTPRPIRPKQLAQDSATTSQIITRGSSVWQPGSRKTFGQNYQEGTSLVEDSTAGTSLTQKMRLTTSSVPAGTYVIKVTYRFGQSSDSYVTRIRAQIDDTTTVLDVNSCVGYAGGGTRKTGGFWIIATLTAATHNIDLDYCAVGGGTAYLSDARISLWRAS